MATPANRLANNLNFGALGKATDLRQRLLFTLGALIVFRLGTFLPIPGINPIALQQFFEQQSSGILGIFDTFSGGALGRMGIFALRCNALHFCINNYDINAISNSILKISKRTRNKRKKTIIAIFKILNSIYSCIFKDMEFPSAWSQCKLCMEILSLSLDFL